MEARSPLFGDAARPRGQMEGRGLGGPLEPVLLPDSWVPAPRREGQTEGELLCNFIDHSCLGQTMPATYAARQIRKHKQRPSLALS